VSGLLLATPGHLGETRDEQYRTADLLEIQRLSSRFVVTLSFEGAQDVPVSWPERLTLVTCPGDFVRSDSARGVGVGPAEGLG
jgi:hypothetical protein